MVDENENNVFPGLNSEGFDSFIVAYVVIVDCPEDTMINDVPIIDSTFYANQRLTSSGTIDAETRVAFYSNQEIELLPNFQVGDSSEFTVAILDCETPPIPQGKTCLDPIPLLIDQTEYFCHGPDSGFSIDPINGTQAVWYRFVSPANGIINISACNQGVDTYLDVLQGNECPFFTSLIISDDDCPTGNGNNYASTVTNLNVSAGESYWLEWSDAWSEEAFSFTFEFIAN